MPGKINTLYILDDPSKDKPVHQYVLKALSREEFNPTICYFYGNEKDSFMAQDGIPAISLGLTRDQFRKFSLATVKKLKRVMDEKKISIVHCQRHRPLVHAGFAIRGTGAHALFYTVRATNVLRNWNRRLVFRFIGRRISKVICVSQGVRDYVASKAGWFPSRKLCVIHNGVDMERFHVTTSKREARKFLGVPEEGFYFGIVARLKKAKCHDILLLAFKRVMERFPDTRLAVVGDGPLEERLKQLAGELGTEEKCHFTGRVDYHQVPEAMKAFDCFVHPSFREGLGVAILEAMASGLPVISTDISGIRDIFETKALIGEVVSPRDERALAAAMERFRSMDKEGLEEMGRRARVHVRNRFSREAMEQATLDVYRQFSAGTDV